MSGIRTWPSEVVIVAAADRTQLVARVRELASWCAGHADASLRDIAFTLSCSPESGNARLGLVVSGTEELSERLEHVARRLEDTSVSRISERRGTYYTDSPLGLTGRLAYVFPGEGSQYHGMLSDLCIQFPEARKCFDLLDRAIGIPVFGSMTSGASTAPIANGEASYFGSTDDQADPIWRMAGGAELVLTSNLAVNRVLSLFALEPDALLGHSTGEYSALLAGGMLTVNDEDDMVAHLQAGFGISKRLEDGGELADGVLLAVGGGDSDAILAASATMGSSVCLAMDNCPLQLVFFAAKAVADQAEEHFRQVGAVCRRLPFSRPYHTRFFAAAKDEIARLLDDIAFRAPAVDIYSGATSLPYPSDPHAARELFFQQWITPVRFREAIENMYDANVRIFVEAGARGNLTSFVNDILRGRPHLAVAADVRRRSSLIQLQHLLAQLAADGLEPELGELYRYRKPQLLEFSDRSLRIDKPTPRLALSLPVMRIDNLPQTLRRDSFLPAGNQLDLPAASSPRSSRESTSADDASVNISQNVMIQYFETMEHFLRTQEAVISAWLNHSASDSHDQAPLMDPGVPPSKSLMASPITQDSEKAVHPEHLPPEVVLLDILAEITGYPREILKLSADLDSDLGVDSIKRVEIIAAFRRITGLLTDDDMEHATQVSTLQQILDMATSYTSIQVNGKAYAPMERDFERSSHEATELTSTTDFDVAAEPMLSDHALARQSAAGDTTGSVVVVPLALSLERLAMHATELAAGRHLVAIQGIRVYRWIVAPGSTFRVDLTASVVPGTDSTQIFARLNQHGYGNPSAAVEATFVFGTPAPVERAGSLSLADERSYPWASADFYSQIMFHGPALRGVTHIRRLGADGLEAELAAPVGQGHPTKLSPGTLDAAGQLLGFWTAATLQDGYVVFPSSIAKIEFFGPALEADQPLRAQLRIRSVDEGWLSADIILVDAAGDVRFKLNGWRDHRVAMPDQFFRFRMDPSQVRLSTRWELDGTDANSQIVIRFWNVNETLLTQDEGIWELLLASLILTSAERKEWRTMQPDTRRRMWLVSRVAGKEAGLELLSNDETFSPDALLVEPSVHGHVASLAGHDGQSATVASDAGICDGTILGVGVAAPSTDFSEVTATITRSADLSAESLRTDAEPYAADAHMRTITRQLGKSVVTVRWRTERHSHQAYHFQSSFQQPPSPDAPGEGSTDQ